MLLPLLSEDVEVIIVNDGSTDRTASVLADMTQGYGNIRCLHQENRGQSVARNEGLSVAEGRYVWFVDADDYVEADIARKVFAVLETAEYDIVTIGRIDELPEGGVQIVRLWDETFESGTDYFRKAIRRNTYRTQPWNHIVRRDLLLDNGIVFEPGRMFEDFLHGIKIILAAGRVKMLPIYPYHYNRSNPNSLTCQYRQADYDALYYVDKTAELLLSGSYSLRPTDGEFHILVFQFLSSAIIKKYLPYVFKDSNARKILSSTIKNVHFQRSVRYCALHNIGFRRNVQAWILYLSSPILRMLLMVL